MTIHALYIFDRHCSCIYSREYNHQNPGQGTVNKNNDSDMAQLLFGVVYSLKSLSAKLGATESSDNLGSDPGALPPAANTLRSFSTGHYRVHFLESLSNFKFALVTDLQVDNLQAQLWELYSTVFVGHVLRNALAPVEFGTSKLNSAEFTSLSDAYLSSLPVFL
ncbi:hypothetical protein METBIDRAFT_11644 [Metschnikowia bicuspidata var. bicuspidata NRRL YB-4993]|uniref:Trafficking protein particle complex subunit n=1 Tax=Metschnikowia bicuspidata var. bicuspidata NRRL YB-4993 TaxID=869754 RepID=A0A1A0HAM5_9ASCO|nr:hypothetical protein METBIDRAFT_11644 [Metschnikowia bicuspidata var. bicuspidata NRRL YB-4993]OBA21066.1 hypothetical protein METBIDRAFT_11644 [Metschnikowia bicuspidata var. bicuspidata NRRL YB-4993]